MNSKQERAPQAELIESPPLSFFREGLAATIIREYDLDGERGKDNVNYSKGLSLRKQKHWIMYKKGERER